VLTVSIQSLSSTQMSEFLAPNFVFVGRKFFGKKTLFDVLWFGALSP